MALGNNGDDEAEIDALVEKLWNIALSRRSKYHLRDTSKNDVFVRIAREIDVIARGEEDVVTLHTIELASKQAAERAGGTSEAFDAADELVAAAERAAVGLDGSVASLSAGVSMNAVQEARTALRKLRALSRN